MKHIKSEFDKLTFKEMFTYFLALACMTASIVIISVSLYMPPEGEIHPSVLTYFGISLAFCGSLMGISAHYNNELTKFKAEVQTLMGDRGKGVTGG